MPEAKFVSNHTVKLIDKMGDDLAVVNDARVSMDKHHDLFDTFSDTRLIKYLAKHQHWTPFAQTLAKLHIELPIFTLRQLQRSEVGRVFNEVSGRYAICFDTYFIQDKYHNKPTGSIKQGRGERLAKHEEDCLKELIKANSRASYDNYKLILGKGIAPEEAREILPINVMTKIRITGSLAFWARVYNLRSAPDAQYAINLLADKIAEVVAPIAPISWGALTKEVR